jgi:hypothetical protein
MFGRDKHGGLVSRNWSDDEKKFYRLNLTIRLALAMDKIKLTGQNLGQAVNFKSGRVRLHLEISLITKTAKLKVENSAQTTFRFSTP